MSVCRIYRKRKEEIKRIEKNKYNKNQYIRKKTNKKETRKESAVWIRDKVVEGNQVCWSK